MSFKISTIQPKGCRNFYIEKSTQSMDKRLLIEQSSEGLKISVQDQKSGKIYQIERHMIDGLPKMDLVPKEFFDACYSTIFGPENKIYFHLRLLGGGSDHSTDRQGAQLTRGAQKLFSGGGRTEQDVQTELRDLLQAINQNCSDCIRKCNELPESPKTNFGKWEGLNSQLDIVYRKMETREILNNLDERIDFIEARKKELIQYSTIMYGILDKISSTIRESSNNFQKGTEKKQEIERIRRERNIFASVVDKGTVFLDAGLLDPLLGAKPGTTVSCLFQGYDQFGRPPVDLDEVSRWIDDAEKLSLVLREKRKSIETSICECEECVLPLRKLRVEIAARKTDVLITEAGELRKVLDVLKVLKIKY